MKKRNILMCLEFLGVGGVETAVVTLCKGYEEQDIMSLSQLKMECTPKN